MRVLVACEVSGIVRDAFAAKGHDAWSCDILPTESEGNHIQDDVLKHLDKSWDLMIAHPPCTYLSVAGNAFFNINKYGDKAKKRILLRSEAINFFKNLYNCNISKICMENPVGFLNTLWKKPSQIIHPYFFGDPEKKRTCLWLKNLKPLIHTKIVEPNIYGFYKSGKHKGEPLYYHHKPTHKNKGKDRSKFWPGIAKAMAEQWG